MPLILKVEKDSTQREEAIRKAAQLIRHGSVVAFPTETFYGLAALATDYNAIAKVYLLKRRAIYKSLSILVADLSELENWIENLSREARHLAKNFWPGPLTLVCSAGKTLPPNLTAGTGKIAVRISSHPVAQALVQAVGRPITATSANRSGSPNCRSCEEVLSQLGHELEAIVDAGLTPGGKASTIADVTTWPPKVLRSGTISAQEVLSCWETSDQKG
jgi:L-threonylcarbamoyladenylate synthase